MKLLHIDSSVLGPHSVSRQVSAAIVDRLRQATPSLDLVYRDLTQIPLAHLSGSHLAAAQGAPAPAELGPDLAASAAVLNEFLDADIVVIGAPMYNFTIPSQLKAWIDRIAVAGKTFRYGPNGPEGLAKGKKLVIASARGGVYADGSPADLQEPYLRHLFGFLGVTDIEFVRAEGVAHGPEQKAAALAQAHARIEQALPLAA